MTNSYSESVFLLPEINRCDEICPNIFQTSRSSGVWWISLCSSTSPIVLLIPACRSVLKTLCAWVSIDPTYPTTALSTGSVTENVNLWWLKIQYVLNLFSSSSGSATPSSCIWLQRNSISLVWRRPTRCTAGPKPSGKSDPASFYNNNPSHAVYLYYDYYECGTIIQLLATT